MPKNKSSSTEQLDVDIRFLLANERTLLAWIRTSLALMAGGIAITQFGEKTDTKSILGVIVISVGALMAILGYSRYKAADRAIRSGTLPSQGNSPVLQVGMVVLFAALLIGVELALL